MVAVPTLAQEDAKRPSRERETLVGEASRIITRVEAAFVRLGIRGFNPKLKTAATRPIQDAMGRQRGAYIHRCIDP
jgi:transposase